MWLRKPAEFDCRRARCVSRFLRPRVTLFEPAYADHMQEYGKGGLKALRLGASPTSRGSTGTRSSSTDQTAAGLKANGTPSSSSGGELTQYCIDDLDRSGSRSDLSASCAPSTTESTATRHLFRHRASEQLLHDTEPDFTDLRTVENAAHARARSTRLTPGDRPWRPIPRRRSGCNKLAARNRTLPSGREPRAAAS